MTDIDDMTPEFERLGIQHVFTPHGVHERFCGFPLEDGMCGWADWLHPTGEQLRVLIMAALNAAEGMSPAEWDAQFDNEEDK